jgi:hypothetical protein
MIHLLPRFFAVFLDWRNALAVGAPFDPGVLILSPDPLRMRSLFLWILAYKPGFIYNPIFFWQLYHAHPSNV